MLKSPEQLVAELESDLALNMAALGLIEETPARMPEAICPRLVASLPQTKTCRASHIEWQPVEDAEFPFVVGMLTINSVPRIKVKASVQYVVAEIASNYPGREFHLAKVTSGTDPDAESYSVFCSRSGTADNCNCKGFVYSGGCKHAAACRELIANEWL